MVGDSKAVACIEDTAVTIEDLKDYIGEFTQIMKNYQQKAVYYAHAGAGELHLRPILNLKKQLLLITKVAAVLLVYLKVLKLIDWMKIPTIC